jgi:hypothetical protein
VRLSRHGGTLVILPQDVAEQVESTRKPIALEYRFVEEEPRRRYRSLQLQLLLALAVGPPTWEAYVESTHPELVTVDEALLELAHTIGGLADVDGAVVLNKRFEVIGFGGEILGDLPDVPRVMRARDLEGESCDEERRPMEI